MVADIPYHRECLLPRQAPSRPCRTKPGSAPICHTMFAESRYGECRMTQGRLKHFGWGREGEGLTAEEEAAILDRYHQLFGVEHFDEVTPPPLSDIELRQPRIVPPASLARCCSSEPYDRAAHTYGKSFSDYARGLVG